MERNKPIGMFDSGVGGLTVWSELVRLLPNESFRYIADSAHAPYGEQPPDRIVERSQHNTRSLLDQGCKLIVVACNTATTLAIATLRDRFEVPFIGIEPAFKPAALQSSRKKVGVLATRGTLNSTLFQQTYTKFGQDVQTTISVGKGLVELIESGQKDSPEMDQLLHRYIDPMIRDGVDYIVLGCTHYPFLRNHIQRMTPKHVQIIDAGAAVARQAQRILEQHALETSASEPGVDHFFTNGDPAVLEYLIQQINPERNYRITTL